MLTGSQNFDHRSVVVVKNPDSTTLNEKHFIADIAAPKHEQLIVKYKLSEISGKFGFTLKLH